jgi:hypothetical protein
MSELRGRTTRCTRRTFTLALAVFATISSSRILFAQKTYYIAEQMTYSGNNGCPLGGDLHVVTASLRTVLNDNGWSGSRFTEAAAFPQDFWESCAPDLGAGGLDNVFGDARTLTVYAGHGLNGSFDYGFARNGQCNANFRDQVRLGMMGGAAAAYGMWLNSFSLENIMNEWGAQNEWIRQHFGYANSPLILEHEPRDFFEQSASLRNVDAWLNVAQSDGDHPTVATMSPVSLEDCWAVHNAAKLKGNVLVSPLGGGPACMAERPVRHLCWEGI